MLKKLINSFLRHKNIDSLKLEFRVPISPNEKYMRMLHFFLESLQQFGGNIAKNAHCVALVGEDIEPFDLTKIYKWTLNYSIDFIWVDRGLFQRDSYDATGYERFFVESNADVVAMVDVDLLFVGDFDNAIIDTFRNRCISGCIAHVSPFNAPEFSKVPSRVMWEKLFGAAGLFMPKLEFEHTGWGLMSKDIEHRYCPAYFNYGFVIAPREVVELIGKSFIKDIRIVESVLDVWFKSQIANTISVYRNKIPYCNLPMNYNFPLHVSDDKIRKINEKRDGKCKPKDIKIFHYLGEGEFNKEDFETEESLNRALNRDGISESARYFQNFLIKVNLKI